MTPFPLNFCLMVRKEDGWGTYSGCGIRRVCFEKGLKTIEGEILSDNPDLAAVTIPACVQKVDYRAFGGCTKLQHLQIEGNMSRLADWSEDAFEGCACEDHYKKLRQNALHTV